MTSHPVSTCSFLSAHPITDRRLMPLLKNLSPHQTLIILTFKSSSKGSVLILTVVLVFDGEAEDVAGLETSAVVHAAVEERMGVRILNVQDLTCGRHVACDTLICRDTELLLFSSHTHTEIHTMSDVKSRSLLHVIPQFPSFPFGSPGQLWHMHETMHTEL